MSRTDRVVSLVSGVSGGIGAAVAEGLVGRGDIVVGGDLARSDRVPGDVAFSRLDVSQEDSWAALVASTLATHGRIDNLVNVAGIIRHAGVEDLSLDEWESVTAVNQLGTWRGMRAVVPHMAGRRAGTIVNFSSGWGVTAGTGNVAYQMNKGAIISLTRAVAIEFARTGIRVNAVLPGWTDSPMTSVQPAESNAATIAAVPLGRGGLPADHVGAVVYLTSDASSYVSASTVTVDGAAVAV